MCICSLPPSVQLHTHMSLQEGITGVFPFKPFKSNTFHRYFGSPSKSLKVRGQRQDHPRAVSLFARGGGGGVILAVGSTGLPLLPLLLQVLPPPALGCGDLGLNANLVISINDWSPVLITPTLHLVVAVY